eukprot:TRINITY_DN2856_c0_g1_i1.p1 TRINITY_DN2856_c0_g1~~TRINITY_DN2856_c0_g1_i1.p1  ORF type:complete len:182 (-),score=18.12 TRINITY_DN2856_c0_g1_i1:342-887(-)
MIRRPPRSTQGVSSAASDVYKRQVSTQSTWGLQQGRTQMLFESLTLISNTAPFPISCKNKRRRLAIDRTELEDYFVVHKCIPTKEASEDLSNGDFDLTLPSSLSRAETQINSVSIAIGTDEDSISAFSSMSPESQIYLPQYCFTSLYGVQEKAVQANMLLQPDCSHSHSTPSPQLGRANRR